MSDPFIRVIVNGQPLELAAGATVADLLTALDLGERRVAVEKNRAVVPRAEHARTRLASGDRLEVVSFVGGG